MEQDALEFLLGQPMAQRKKQTGTARSERRRQPSRDAWTVRHPIASVFMVIGSIIFATIMLVQFYTSR